MVEAPDDGVESLSSSVGEGMNQMVKRAFSMLSPRSAALARGGSLEAQAVSSHFQRNFMAQASEI